MTVAQLGGIRRRRIMQRISHRDGGWKCHYCGRKLTPVADLRQPVSQNDPERPTLDHVTPKSRGGRNQVDNFVLSCVGCNERKADSPIALVRLEETT